MKNKISSKSATARTTISFIVLIGMTTQYCTNAAFLNSKPTTKTSFFHPHDVNLNVMSNTKHYQYQNYKSSSRFTKLTNLFMSSIGDGNNNNDNNNNDNNKDLDDWLDPRKASSESDNLKRARAQLSEESLPINFDTSELEVDADAFTDANDDDIENVDTDTDDIDSNTDTDTTLIDDNSVQDLMDQKQELSGQLELLKTNATTTAALMSSNPYLQVVSKLSPSDLISKFTSTAHPRVQDAVRSTVLGLIGNLPKMAFETTTITTGERLASLMFQLQLTGYMLKNADYRVSLSQSLGGMSSVSTGKNGQNQYLLEGDLDIDIDDDDDYDEEEGRLSEGKVKGKIKITYGKTNDETDSTNSDDEDDDDDGDNEDQNSLPSMEVEVDAAAYMAELRNEVAKLREDLVTTRKEKEDEIRKDLLLYIRTLPQKELKSLTNTLSDDVLNAMKGLVNVVMAGIGEGEIGPETVTEQSGEAMAQLCMWQLVVGYNLRELEVREEMKNALRSGSLDFGDDNESSGESGSSDGEGNDDEEGSIDFEKGGFE
jgi:hypothetical protein